MRYMPMHCGDGQHGAYGRLRLHDGGGIHAAFWWVYCPLRPAPTLDAVVARGV